MSDVTFAELGDTTFAEADWPWNGWPVTPVGPSRDLNLCYAIGTDRWSATTGTDRWAATVTKEC